MTVPKFTEDEVRQQAAECEECNGPVYCFFHKMRYMAARPAWTDSKGTKTMRGLPDRPRNSWEKGRAYRDRPGGFQVPVLTSSGSHMGVHEYAEKRSRFEAQEGS